MLVLFCVFLIFTTLSYAYFGTVTKLDDLYRLVVKSSEFKGVSKQAFKASLRTKDLTKIYPFIQGFPREDRIRLLMEIAEQRKLVSGTQSLRYAATYSKIKNGDELLFKTIDIGDKKLLDLAPLYGEKLLIIEKKYKDAGLNIINSLGDDGWNILNKLPDEQIPVFARQASNISKLEEKNKNKILRAISDYPVKALEYLDTHSSIVYKASGISVFFVFIDNLSQPNKTIVTKPDGTVIETVTSLLGTFEGFGKFTRWIIGIAVAFGLLLLGVRFWRTIKNSPAKEGGQTDS